MDYKEAKARWIEPLSGELGEISGRAVFHQKKKILWLKPKAVTWGILSLERSLEHLFEVRCAWATFSRDMDITRHHLEKALEQIDGIECVIYDGVAFIDGLTSKLQSLDIPIVSYKVNVDESGYDFDDDINEVIDSIFEAIYSKKFKNKLMLLLEKKIEGSYLEEEHFEPPHPPYSINPEKLWPLKKIFISYSKVDEDIVHRVALDLRAKYDVWVDFLSLKAGQQWENEIERNIQSGEKIILFLSSEGLSKRGYFQFELRMAEKIKDMFPERSTPIIPCRIDECEPPAFLRKLHFLDLHLHDYNEFLRRVTESIDIV